VTCKKHRCANLQARLQPNPFSRYLVQLVLGKTTIVDAKSFIERPYLSLLYLIYSQAFHHSSSHTLWQYTLKHRILREELQITNQSGLFSFYST